MTETIKLNGKTYQLVEEEERDIFEKVYDKFVDNDYDDQCEDLKHAIQEHMGITRKEIRIKLLDPTLINFVAKMFEDRGLLIDDIITKGQKQ